MKNTTRITCTLLNSTPMALRVHFDGQDMWIPRSVIPVATFLPFIMGEGKKAVLHVENWWLHKRNLSFDEEE